jgi:hypothetical protein
MPLLFPEELETSLRGFRYGVNWTFGCEVTPGVVTIQDSG